MLILFVGGTRHGTTAQVSEDQATIYIEDQGVDGPRQQYHVRRWARADEANGFDALFVWALVHEDDAQAAIMDALRVAGIDIQNA